MLSNKSFMPSPFLAETGIIWVSPPQSSGTKPIAERSPFTFSTSASGVSILFIATIIWTPASFAWLYASSVCGLTLSSAATTKITISVELAPLARICEKAACPGVSMKVINESLYGTW